MKRALCILTVLITSGACLAQVFPVETIFQTGDPGSRINLVFLSDGYKSNELDTYITDVNVVLDDIFKQSPFKEYKSYFNAYAIKVPSTESGAGHPRTASDCPSEAAQPTLSPVNNYFGSKFDVGGIHRLLVPSNNTALASVLADNFPLYDQPFVLVNSLYYGGSGGPFATSSTEASSSEVAIHEIGHSFAFLADEYWAGPSYAAESPNLTQENNPAQVKWKNWLGKNSIGIYAHAESPSWYRPHQNCKMRFLNVPFCSVCKERFVETIHNYINPLIAYSPAESNLELTDGELEFSVELLKPDPNTFKITWKKNDVIMGTKQNQETITIGAISLTTGINSIQAVIIDTTTLTRSDSHLQNHFYVIDWTINTDNVTGIDITSSKAEYEISIFPNPSTDELNLSYTLSKGSHVNVTFLDASGKQIKKLVNNRQPAGKHDYKLRSFELNMKTAGLYYISIDINGVQTIEKLVKN